MTLRESVIYVVDDDVSAREGILGVIRSAGLRGYGFASAPEFLAHPREHQASCLVLDVEMPELSGLDLQQRLNAANDAMPIVFLTGHADVPMSVTAIKAGAVDFLTKPFDAETLLDVIRHALCEAGTRSISGQPAPHAAAQPREIEGIVGGSHGLHAVLRQVRTVAPTETTVLIQGETGTGKERFARALHDLSTRKDGRFVKVNCAAIPAGLLESELMGHEKGAFTGALAQRIGRFELAHNGTIFLDEIGELPIELQPKLLRILQEREFERLGGARTVHTNARVIAATNRDLRSMTALRTFREDLYYRLNVFPIQIPPLRERMQDIPLLATHFVNLLATRMGRELNPISAEGLRQLSRHHWPGNIRELQNVLERAVILAERGTIHIPNLVDQAATPAVLQRFDEPEHQSSAPPASETAPASDGLAEVTRVHILRVLEEADWVIAGPNGAAARLDMKRSTLNFRMKKLGITRPTTRRAEEP